jgi:hypothetical protein
MIFEFLETIYRNYETSIMQKILGNPQQQKKKILIVDDE